MILANIRSYLKFLSRNRLYTFVSVLGFSVSLMFVVVLAAYSRQELSFDDFHANGDRIYMLMQDRGPNFGNPIGQYVADRIPEVESYTRYFSRRVTVEKEKEETFLWEVSYTDPDFFRIFSFDLVSGNPEDVLVREKTVALSETMARRLFGDEDPMGRQVTIDGEPNTVTGVYRDFPYNTHFVAPDFILNYLSLSRMWGEGPDGTLLNSWNNFGFQVYFLARPGTDIHSKEELLLADLKKDAWYFQDGRGTEVTFVPLRELHLHPLMEDRWLSQFKASSRTAITVYIAVAFLILLFAVLNYINTTVAQSTFRGKEAAIRKLLGSGRRRIIGQLLGESAMMTLFSSIVGIGLAFLAEPYFNYMLGTRLDLARQFSVPVILAILLFIAVLSVVAGTIPAIFISRFKPVEVIKGTFRRRVKTSYSTMLGIFQYTVSIVLLICSFFILRQSDFLRNNDMGLTLDRSFFIENITGGNNIGSVRSELQSIAGVEKVSLVSGMPIIGGNDNSFEWNDIPVSVQVYIVDSVFFDILGLSVTPVDNPVNGTPVILNSVAYNGMQPEKTDGVITKWGESFTVTGIVSDFKFRPLNTPAGMVWIEVQNDNPSPWELLVKISDSADVVATVEAIRDTYARFTDGRPFESGFLQNEMQSWYEKELRTASMMWAFTVLTLLIMVTGVFAMALYTVRQREKEIGIRKVNGATTGEVLGLLNRRSALTVLVSFVVACPVAWFAMERWLRQFAYKIDLSWWVFLLAGAIVLGLTVVCVTWQSFHTARMNPVDTLKSE